MGHGETLCDIFETFPMEREGTKGQAAFPSRGETVRPELAIGMYGEGNRNGGGLFHIR